MKKYWNYLKYVLEHKKNVFIECWKVGLYLHAFAHDLSKFRPTEFISYAKRFYGNEEEKQHGGFELGWLHHQRKNKHHWDYWVNGDGTAVTMPPKYVLQMLCDWKGMSRKFGDTAQAFYKKNRHKMNLTVQTRCLVEYELSFIDGLCFGSNVTWDEYLKMNGKDEDEDFALIMQGR